MSALVEFRNYENKSNGLEIFYECKDGTTILHSGSLKSWECEAGPLNVNKDHVFLGYDFLKYDARTCNKDEMTIQFYVMDANGNCVDIHVCEVKMCGFRLLRCEDIQNPAEVAVTREEVEEDEQRRKRLKLSDYFEHDPNSS